MRFQSDRPNARWGNDFGFKATGSRTHPVGERLFHVVSEPAQQTREALMADPQKQSLDALVGVSAPADDVYRF